MFQHFREHQQGDRAISFLKFLNMHYMHGSPKDKDYSKDMKLPFKTSGDFVSVLANEFVPDNIQYSILAPEKILTVNTVVIQENDILPSYLSSIWQPPKSC